MPGNISVDEVSGKSFDFVVVGGGTAGLRLAEKLTRETQFNVLVLDAGDISLEDPNILIPGQYGAQFGQEQYDWNFQTTPQKWSNNTKFAWNRGKVLGGSSGINFMCWIKPPKDEVDDWERLGNPGWNWNNFQAAVKEIEGYTPPTAKSTAAHGLNFQDWEIGTGGPLKLFHPATISQPEIKAYETLINLGIPKAPAPMSGDPRGAYFTPKTIDHQGYTRSYSMTAFYFPHIDRPNMKVLTRAYATQLVTSGQSTLTATGVEFTHDGKTYVVHASKEVVLCAGTLKSPQILELSGIGRRDVLESIGVPLKLELPGVGENVQEHMFTGISFELKDDVEDVTLDILRDPEGRKEQIELHKKAEGAFTLAIDGFAFTPMRAISDRIKDVYEIAKKKIQDEWDTYSPGLQAQYKIQLKRLEDPNSAPGEFVLVPGFLSHPNPPKPGKKYFTILLCLNHNFSRGTIHSVSSDPKESPACDPHYFEHDVDLQTFVELAKFARKTAKASPLRDILIDEPEVNPGPNCDDSQLADWLRTTSATTYHTVGSLSMLPEGLGGVVDPNLKVYGTTNVRVADLSVIPLHVAAHTLTTAYAIGARAADIIAHAHT